MPLICTFASPFAKARCVVLMRARWGGAGDDDCSCADTQKLPPYSWFPLTAASRTGVSRTTYVLLFIMADVAHASLAEEGYIVLLLTYIHTFGSILVQRIARTTRNGPSASTCSLPAQSRLTYVCVADWLTGRREYECCGRVLNAVSVTALRCGCRRRI